MRSLFVLRLGGPQGDSYRVYLFPKGDFPHETFHGIIPWSLVGFSLELPTVVCFYGSFHGSFHGKPISSHDEIYPPAGCIGTFPGTYPIWGSVSQDIIRIGFHKERPMRFPIENSRQYHSFPWKASWQVPRDLTGYPLEKSMRNFCGI